MSTLVPDDGTVNLRTRTRALYSVSSSCMHASLPDAVVLCMHACIKGVSIEEACLVEGRLAVDRDAHFRA